jgi:DNA-binding MarR family transcriptional regulator
MILVASNYATISKYEHGGLQQVSSSMQQQPQIEWRRAKVLELMSKGETNQSEIARILQLDRSIVCRDVAFLRQQAKENISRYVDERLPEDY